MKKRYSVLLFSIFCSVANAQTPAWGNWFTPDPCLKGIAARVKMEGINNTVYGPSKYRWTFSIRNEYSRTLHFDLNLLSPTGYAEFKSGKRKGLEGTVGRMNIKPGESIDWGGFDILLPTPSTVRMWIRNVRFSDGKDEVIGSPYVVDDCGHNTLEKDQPDNNSAAKTLNESEPSAAVATTVTNQTSSQGSTSINNPINNTTATNNTVYNGTAVQPQTANQAQTQQYINQAQNPNNDAIQSSLAINQAKINAMKPGSATYQQQQQIQHVQAQQNAANTEALATETGNLIGSLVTLIGNGSGHKSERETREENYANYITGLKSSNNPKELITVGIDYDVKKDYKAAMSYFKRAGDLGQIDGYIRLERLYASGLGVPKDDSIAASILRKSYNIELGRQMHDDLENIEGLAYALLDCASVFKDKFHQVPTGALAPNQNELAMMAMVCYLYLDKNCPADFENLDFGDFIFTEAAEIQLGNLYAINLDKSKTQVESLKIALSFYEKSLAMSEKYLASGLKKDSYKKYSYKDDTKQAKQGKENVIRQLKALNIKEK